MPDRTGPDEAAYLAHRSLILRIGYDITGSWTDAEDVAQQVFVRWQGVRDPVRNPRAYLARMATNAALDAVAVRERVGYPGPFLPEPVPTGPGADEAVAEAAEIETALMVVLGTLSPLERAAFLLHDVFGFSHPEIAVILDRRPAAVRKLTSRARAHVRAARPCDPVDPPHLRRLTESFFTAATEGDLSGLMDLLTADAVFVGDGGGKASAVRRPVRGAENVARVALGLSTQLDASWRMVPIEANHRPALAMYEGDRLDLVMWIIAEQGRISQILGVRNPDKLGLGKR